MSDGGERDAQATTGPRCSACGHRGPPGASFCAGCGALLDTSCGACRRAIPAGARFCPYCGTAVVSGAAAEDGASRAGSGEELAHGERRRATAFFSDLSGYTELNEALDPEEVAGAMNRLKQAASRIVESHGGTVNQFVGDQVMALFGVPRAHDDDPLRAVRAAHELHRFVRELGDELAPRLGLSLRLHTAVNTGLMITQVRDRRDGLYGVTGDVINTCARLASAAAEDEVLVGEDTHRAVRDYFETERLGPLTLRGKASPVVAHRLVRPLVERRFDVARSRGLTEFTGRESELDMLRGALDEARAGRSGFVSVVGEAGMGKSRLLHEFEHSAPGELQVLHGHCPSYGTVAPYHPFRELLGEALALGDDAGADDVVAELGRRMPGVESHVPVLLALLSLRSDAHPLPRELVGERLQEALFSALHAVLAALARTRPVLVALEDWHWADSASATALRQLAGRLRRERVLLVVAYRSYYRLGWSTPNGVRVELAPLARRETRRIVERLLERELPGGLVERVHERTGGNPFFIEEVCRAIGESQGAGGGLEGMVVPETVEAVLHARIDRLDPASVDALKLASVLGEEFAYDLLERISPPSLGSVDAALEHLMAGQLIQPVPEAREERYRFKHAIVQDVAYEMLLLQHRRQLHAAAGRAIERACTDRIHEHFEALAHHYSRSDERDKAVFYLERSGDKAALSGAMVQALGHYREAVRTLDALEETPEQMARRIELAIKLANTALYRPSQETVGILASCRDQAERLGDRRTVMRSLYWIGWVESALGSWSQAIDHMERCIALADPRGDGKLLAQLYSNLGQALFHGGDYERSRRELERAIELRREISGADSRHPTISYSIGYLGLLEAESGRFEAAYRSIEDAFRRMPQPTHMEFESVLISIRCMIELFRGDWSACRKDADELAPRARRIGSTYMQALSLANGGYVRFVEGERGEGVRRMRESLALLEGGEVRMNIGITYAFLAESLALQGELDEAERLADLALERARLGDRLGEALAERVRFLVAAGRYPGEPARAEAALARALEVAEAKGALRDAAVTRLRAAEVLGGARDADWRRRMLEPCAKSFAAMKMPWYERRAGALLSGLGSA